MQVGHGNSAFDDRDKHSDRQPRKRTKVVAQVSMLSLCFLLPNFHKLKTTRPAEKHKAQQVLTQSGDERLLQDHALFVRIKSSRQTSNVQCGRWCTSSSCVSLQDENCNYVAHSRVRCRILEGLGVQVLNRFHMLPCQLRDPPCERGLGQLLVEELCVSTYLGSNAR